MRRLLPLVLLLLGCSASKYTFSFELSDPGAKNATKPGERGVVEDADLTTEVLVDATNFQAVLVSLTNKTSNDVTVEWHRATMVNPDRVEMPLRPDGAVPPLVGLGKVTVRLVTFSLPTVGGDASRFDNGKFELVLPMVIRGQSAEKRLHFVAHANKL